MDWQTVVLNILYFTIGSGLLIWLIKKIFTHYFDKDIEKYKHGLQQEQIKFSKLYDERAKVISKLYELLDILYSNAHSLAKPLQMVGEASETEKSKN